MSAVKVTHSCPLGCWIVTCPGQPPSHHATELDAKRRRRWHRAQRRHTKAAAVAS